MTATDFYELWDAKERAERHILDRLREALLRYVVFPSSSAVDAVTLWIAATHGQSSWNCATRLVIKAPEKRCGKSRLLDIIEATCHNPLITVNISPAALVRSIGTMPPTLLLDESDAVFGRKAADAHEDLRGILNAGHQRNRPYIRWDATARSAESCPTFAMAALAGIGDMPDTIEDRAVIVSMRRRSAGEDVAPYRVGRDRPALQDVQRELAAWVDGIRDDLAAAEPHMPIEDRAADNWEPLIAVADAAGGDWPARARTAALTIVHTEAEADTERSTGLRLLADIRDVTVNDSFVASADLVARLHSLSESPWSEFNLTARQVASRVKKYGVHAGHDTTKTVRGYKVSDFADAWLRYLPGLERPETSERPEPPELLAFPPDASSSTDDQKRPYLADPSGENPDKHWAADARTAADARPQGNPTCNGCGRPNLFARESIERGVCASCVKTEAIA